MFDNDIRQIRSHNRKALRDLDALLRKEGIEKDGNLDYTVGLFDENDNLMATGSAFMNTLRCLAVDSKYQGEGLLNKIITHLLQYQLEKGNSHVFLYTKCDKAKFFESLGFHEIVRVENRVVFMENKRNGFGNYLDKLAKTKGEGTQGAIVMNANPFTNGHLYLVETAAKQCDTLHLFAVSEDASLVPFKARMKLIKEGTAHLDNIIYHETGSYLISSATFPSYFLKDADIVAEAHTRLDMEIFGRIAQAVGITKRFAGEEKASRVTAIYNDAMRNILPDFGVESVIIPRLEQENVAVSASNVRLALKNDDFESLKKLVPPTTYDFFMTDEGKAVVEKIKNTDDVVHH
ncbi:MAG: [citrate (pro-3S)-lyase] ligase [Ruminococcaceae bacterium]|nr:[citrate (pro-3S)-lyase] ligase [Oscillospiraceae bacterium]